MELLPAGQAALGDDEDIQSFLEKQANDVSQNMPAAGNCMAWKEAPGAGLSLRLHSPLVRVRPLTMHQRGQCASAQC